MIYVKRFSGKNFDSNTNLLFVQRMGESFRSRRCSGGTTLIGASIPPNVLIPLAEQSGDISEIGKWVLEQACNDRHRWDLKGG